jgi:hypothetical protein
VLVFVLALGVAVGVGVVSAINEQNAASSAAAYGGGDAWADADE